MSWCIDLSTPLYRCNCNAVAKRKNFRFNARALQFFSQKLLLFREQNTTLARDPNYHKFRGTRLTCYVYITHRLKDELARMDRSDSWPWSARFRRDWVFSRTSRPCRRCGSERRVCSPRGWSAWRTPGRTPETTGRACVPGPGHCRFPWPIDL